jgi:hypothetical protein
MTDREREAGSNRCRRRRRSRRRKRPAKLAPGAIAELFIAPVMVRADGVSRKMLAFEASLYSQVKRALVNRDVGAMAQIIALCERYGLLERMPEPPLRSGLYIIPKNWPEAEWRAMFKRHGPPPWPGRRSGLPD